MKQIRDSIKKRANSASQFLNSDLGKAVKEEEEKQKWLLMDI